MPHPKIPKQLEGGFHDTVSMCCADSLQVADSFYHRLEKRLLAINNWPSYSDKVKAGFTLFEGTNRNTTTFLEQGNIVRIDIPGIGNPSGGGYDWTKIIDIQKSEAWDYPFYLFTLKPCSEYGESNKPVSHFYTEAATNTFIVRKVGTCIYAEVHGRNEVENVNEAPLLDKLRNNAVALGSKLGIGNLNWLGFTKALLEPFQNQENE